MANEITVRFSMQVENGFYKDRIDVGQLRIDQNAAGAGGYVQSIGTTEEVVDFGDVGTEGLLVMRNLDATNYVQWGPESAGAMVNCGRIPPGEFAYYRVDPGVVLRAKANTAACLLQVKLLED